MMLRDQVQGRGVDVLGVWGVSGLELRCQELFRSCYKEPDSRVQSFGWWLRFWVEERGGRFLFHAIGAGVFSFVAGTEAPKP